MTLRLCSMPYAELARPSPCPRAYSLGEGLTDHCFSQWVDLNNQFYLLPELTDDWALTEVFLMKSMTLAQAGSANSKNHELASNLAHLLADTYLLALKTQNFHWNVEGPQFYHLHMMFETQYSELQAAADVIAERIRAVGFYSPGSYDEFKKLTQVKEVEGKAYSSQEMVGGLLEDHENVAKSLKKFSAHSAEQGDAISTALFDDRALNHEKTAWMLRSLMMG